MLLSPADCTGLRLVLTLFRLAPARSLAIVALLVLAGFAEGLGIATFLPLLAQAPGLGSSHMAGALPSSDAGTIQQTIGDFFARIDYVPAFGELLIFVALAFCLKAALLMLAATQIGFAAIGFATGLRLAMLEALSRARWGYFTKLPVGSTANAMTTEIGHSMGAYGSTFELVNYSIQVLVYLGIAAAISWQLTLGAIVAGIGVFILMHAFVVVARRAAKQQRSSFENLVTGLVDTLSGIKPIKAMARENRLGPLLAAETQLLDKAQRRDILSKTGLQNATEPLLVVLLCAGLYAALAMLGADLVSLIVVALMFYRGVNRMTLLQRTYQDLARREHFLEAIARKLMAAVDAREPQRGSLAPTCERHVRFENVCFSFESKVVLHDVSFEIRAGEITTIAGPSGSGKSTLADLLLGFYEPATGAIRIDGVDLQQVDIQKWRAQIGYVPQDLHLLSDSVLANVTLGDPHLTDQDGRKALQAADAWEFVSQLPAGIHTNVGERGAQLSGGQRQRIALARALVHRPKLLILDEPTTALDRASEAAICQTLHKLRGAMTILAISHQPALVGIADNVLHIENGRVAAPVSPAAAMT
jgi:ATP-binding cassette subfamily C protein